MYIYKSKKLESFLWFSYIRRNTYIHHTKLRTDLDQFQISIVYRINSINRKILFIYNNVDHHSTIEFQNTTVYTES